MRIQGLDLYGFKSFPDRTKFQFGTGISCVVGPNGSGKSNVVDALRWVIGEQSARSLRGKDMSDVIFAGSAERSPVGFAEVTLTLSVGNGEPFPGDYARFESLEVGRRLYRDGTSEYLLNQVKCRRRDIVDLFMDTGVGANLYSFIAQGQVDRIVSQSAMERRGLIDEAAGISRFKARREESLKELSAAAAQLDRASDASDAMASRLKVLERQVVKAGRFRRARAQIRQREIALGVVKYGALAEDRRSLRETARRLEDAVGAQKRSEERLAADLEVREAEVGTARERLTSLRDSAAELEAQRREQEGARSLYADRHQEQLEALKRAEQRAGRADLAVAEAEDRGAGALARLKVAEARVETVELVALRAAASEASAEVASLRGTLSELSAKEAARLERVVALEEERDRANSRRDDLRAVPLAPMAQDEGGVAAALALRDGAKVSMEEARRSVESSRAILRAAEVVESKRRSDADAQRAGWAAARRRIEGANAIRRREHEVMRKNLEASAEAAWTEARRAARERAAVWQRALEEDVRLRREAVEVAHRSAERLGRAELETQETSLSEEEERSLAEVSSRVDRSALQAAREELASAEAAVELAQVRRSEAEESRLVVDGRLGTARAEWKVLESRRVGELPDAWGALPLFDEVAAADDPRRTTRPEFAALPVIAPEGLVPEVAAGRAVLGLVVGSWVIVDGLEALKEHLGRHGPPVATRDGRIRVDIDGGIHIGEREDRWSKVRDSLLILEPESESARERVIEAETRLLQAREHLEGAKEALAPAEKAVESALAAAVESVRQRFKARRAEVRDHAESDAARRSEDRERETAALLEELERSRSLGEHVRSKVEGGIPKLVVDHDALEAALESALDGVPPEPDSFEASALLEDRSRLSDHEDQLQTLVAAWEDASRHWQGEVDAARQAEAARAAATAQQEARSAEVVRLEERIDAISTTIRDLPPIVGLDLASASVDGAEAELVISITRLQEAEAENATMREVLAADRVVVESAVAAAGAARAEKDAALAEGVLATEAAASAAAKSDEANQRAQTVAEERALLLEKIKEERVRLEKVTAECERVRKTLGETRESLSRDESGLSESQQRVASTQSEIEDLRKQLGDRYQVSLPGLLDRLWMRHELVLQADAEVSAEVRVNAIVLEAIGPLTISRSLAEDPDAIRAMVGEVEALRKQLSSFGDVNLAAQGEWEELSLRYTEYAVQREDIEGSIRSLRSAIAAMNRTCRERFRDAYDRVNEAFQLSYPRLVGGGDARLALTDEDDLLETGVDIFVRPPGKRLQNLTLLSGGEKAMTAIALLLALFQVRPSPFCVLDEVDAPLDEANGARFNDMIKEMSSLSQFIVITHNRKTMECADVLYGVTMSRPGVSALVSVAFEREADG